MLEFRTPILIEEAVSRIMDRKSSGAKEYVSIHESYGRFLSEDLVATNNVPHFDRASFDGFAVRTVDLEKATADHPIELQVIDHIGAGYVSNKEVGPFQAVRIMTGAQMPKNADSVIKFELTKTFEREGKSYMLTKHPSKWGDNITYIGDDTKKGEVLIHKGTKINPGIQAMLATFGYAQVPVASQPKVGLFATGTELLDVGDPLEPGKIRNSNSYMIRAQIERAGAQCYYFGTLHDEFATCYSALKEAMSKVDLLITTGGVSVGDFDYLPAIYERLGAEVLFNKVAMRPGSVTTVAHHNGKFLFGLSGNPSASYVGFELFVRPIIRTMLFSTKPHLKKEKAILKIDFPKVNPFTRFVRSTLSVSNGRLAVSPSGLDKSNIVTSLGHANSFIILPGGTRGFQANDEVEVLLLEDQEGSEWPW